MNQHSWKSGFQIVRSVDVTRLNTLSWTETGISTTDNFCFWSVNMEVMVPSQLIATVSLHALWLFMWKIIRHCASCWVMLSSTNSTITSSTKLFIKTTNFFTYTWHWFLKCNENWTWKFQILNYVCRKWHLPVTFVLQLSPQLHMSSTGLNCAAAVLFPLDLILSFIVRQMAGDKNIFLTAPKLMIFWFLAVCNCS